MSIFETPTAVQPRVDDPMVDDDPPRQGFDPRSVQIAAIVTAALVVLGLLVSNAAKPEPEVRPAVTSRVAPGAAAVEEAEGAQAPVEQPAEPPASASGDEPVDEPISVESDAPTWQEPQASTSETDSSGKGKWDGHPGKGHGRGR